MDLAPIIISIKDLLLLIKQKSIFRKNQKEVVYVLADMAGDLESPSYAISNISDSLKTIQLPIELKVVIFVMIRLAIDLKGR